MLRERRLGGADHGASEGERGGGGGDQLFHVRLLIALIGVELSPVRRPTLRGTPMVNFHLVAMNPA
jgi:hypothetical protein